MAFTSRMTGASLAMSRRCSRSSLACGVADFGIEGLLRAFAVVLVDGVDDFLLGRQRRFDPKPGEGSHGRDGFEVQRIGHGQQKRGVLHSHGHEAALTHEARRQSFQFLRSGRWRIQGDQRHSELLGERGQHIARRDEAHVHQDLAQLVAAFPLQFQRALQIFLLDQAPRDQHFA